MLQIQKAREESEILQQDADAEAAKSRALEDEFDDSDKRERKYSIKNPEKVLVRLKVEHTGFTTLNNQRFGSQFVGQVVSCHAIFVFIKCVIISCAFALPLAVSILLYLSFQCARHFLKPNLSLHIW